MFVDDVLIRCIRDEADARFVVTSLVLKLNVVSNLTSLKFVITDRVHRKVMSSIVSVCLSVRLFPLFFEQTDL